jgi:hypothetical protein
VPQVSILGPLHKLELPDEQGLEPAAPVHFRCCQSRTPAAGLLSGGLANGHSSVSGNLNFLSSSARSCGVKPLRPAGIHQPLAIVVAEGHRIERGASP